MTEEKQKFVYVPKTDDEIKQLAFDTMGQKIFWATMIPKEDNRMIHSVFMVLAFMDNESLKPLQDIHAIPYEYFAKAGDRSVNGFPMFMSAQYVSLEDYRRMVEKLKLLEAAVAAV